MASEQWLDTPRSAHLEPAELACGPAGRADDGGGLGPMFSLFDDVAVQQVSVTSAN